MKLIKNAIEYILLFFWLIRDGFRQCQWAARIHGWLMQDGSKESAIYMQREHFWNWLNGGWRNGMYPDRSENTPTQ